MGWTIEKSQRPDIAGNPWQVEAKNEAFEVCALEIITGEKGEHIPIPTATLEEVSAWADRVQAYRTSRRSA